MTDEQLLRYSRHILLPEVGVEGQEKLLSASALVIGAGGLGSPAALYLAAAGVGTVTLADGDDVDLTNLQRQILHTTESLGESKAESGREALARINPQVNSRARSAASARRDARAAGRVERRRARLLGQLRHPSLGESRLRADTASRWCPGAAVRFDGQVTRFRPERRCSAPCYHCLFPENAELEETRCAVMGVFAPLTGIIGTMQAAEALKLLAGIGETLKGRLAIVDALTMQWRTIKLAKDPACPVCASRYGLEA